MANLKTPVPTVTMNTGATIPQLGFGLGTALFKHGGADTSHDEELIKTLKMAMAQGYRHLDAADMYGNEAELGKAIKDAKIKREELFVTTKAWKDVMNLKASLDNSLKRLGLDYVDLYLIHAPFVPAASDEERATKLQSLWEDMEALHASGKAKAIGVSNFTQAFLETVLEKAKVVPAVNQIEFNPYLQHGGLLDFHKSKGIVTACYGPITPVTRAAPGPLDNLLSALAKKYYVHESEICLRYALEKGAVAVTTSSKEQRMSDYMRSVAFKLTPRELQDMDELGAQKHHRGFWTKFYDANDRT